MKTYEVLLNIRKQDVDAVVRALFYAGFAVYKPSYNDEMTVAFTATDEQIHETKVQESVNIKKG